MLDLFNLQVNLLSHGLTELLPVGPFFLQIGHKTALSRSMNTQLGIGETVLYSVVELDPDGKELAAAPTDSVLVVSSDPLSLSVAPDVMPATGTVASGVLIGIKPKHVNVSATVRHSDGSTLNKHFVVEVVAKPISTTAAAIDVKLGAPNLQGAQTKTT